MRVYSDLAISRMANNQSLAGYFKLVLLTRAPSNITSAAPPSLTALLADIGYQELVDSHYIIPTERPIVQISQTTAAGVTDILMGAAITLPADVPPNYLAAVAFYWHGTDAAGAGSTLNGVANPWLMITDESFGQIVYPGSTLDTPSQAPPRKLWSYSLRGTSAPYIVDTFTTGLIRSPGTIAWEPPRTQHVYLYPQKVNYVPNPSFEDSGLFGWRANGALTRVVGGVDNPLNAYGHVEGGRLESIPMLIRSEFVTVSAYVRSTAGQGTIQMGLCTWDTSWVQSADVISSPKVIGTTWTRHSYVTLMPDNISGSGFLITSTVPFDVDLVLMEHSAELHDYFDGDSQTSIQGDFSWQGVTHKSLSFWYNNRFLTGARLFATYQEGMVAKTGLVYDWVPAGTSIYTHWDVLSMTDTKQPLADFPSRLTGPRALSLPGTTGNYVSTPDAAAFDITGDLCLMARITPTNWALSNQVIICKWNTGQLSYKLMTSTGGGLTFQWSVNGSSLLSSGTTVGGLTGAKWVAVTFDVDNGATGRDIKYWVSNDGATWAQLGATVTNPGVTSIFAGTANVGVGADIAGTNGLFTGLIQDARIYSGIGNNTAPGLGTLVGHYTVPLNALSTYTDELGKVWTANGGAWSYVPVF